MLTQLATLKSLKRLSASGLEGMDMAEWRGVNTAQNAPEHAALCERRGILQRGRSAAGLHRKALGPLLEWAEAVVPRRQWGRTPIFLFGTAGLRKLPNEAQQSLLADLRDALSQCSFRSVSTKNLLSLWAHNLWDCNRNSSAFSERIG